MPKIRARVEEGAILRIDDLPLDVTVQVLDCDTRKYEGTERSKPGNGRPCLVKEWHHPE